MRYDINISDVPESIAIIPLLADIAPVSWVEDLTIKLPKIDSNFALALDQIREGFDDKYPGVSFNNGKIVANRIENSSPGYDQQATSGTLFSLGVDSLTSYIEHRDESPALIHIGYWGNDYDDDAEWTEYKKLLERFANKENISFYFIDYSPWEIYDNMNMNEAYKSELERSWWSKVHHGLSHSGACAPLLYAEGISELYIPASFNKKFTEGFGSDPDIINKIKFSDVEYSHDQYISRQKKWEQISSFFFQIIV